MSDKITQQAAIDVSDTVYDAAITTGIKPDTAALVDAEVESDGMLKLTIHGEKDLHQTEHRLPEELR